MKEYGIHNEELLELYQRNSDDELYVKENLYCLTMSCNYRLVDGEESTVKETMIPYFGFSNGEDYDLANMTTGNYLRVQNVEIIEE